MRDVSATTIMLACLFWFASGILIGRMLVPDHHWNEIRKLAAEARRILFIGRPEL